MADSSRIDDLRRRVQRDPASIAFAQLAEEYRRGGHYGEAVETCRAGLALHPGYLSARVTLGRALLELGSLDDAQQELELVLRSAPENLAAIRGTAEIHQRRGDLPKALEYFKAALAFARNDPDLEETVNDLTKKLGHARRGPDTGDGLTLDQIQSIFAAHIPPAPSKPAPPVAPAAPLVLAPASPPTPVAPPAPTVVVAPTATHVESAIEGEPSEGAQADSEPVIEGEAEKLSHIEHLETAVEAEHLASSSPSEHLENARESAHPGRAFDGEHAGSGVEREHLEGAGHTEHVENALEDARATNLWSAERLETVLESRRGERATGEEPIEGAVRPDIESARDHEPPENLTAVEYVETSPELDHPKSAADREHPTSLPPIEYSESGFQTAHGDGAEEGEPLARTNQPDTDNALEFESRGNVSAVEYVESALEPEHPQSATDREHSASRSPIEHSESGPHAERPDGADEGEPLARTIQPDIESALDNEPRGNLSAVEYVESVLEPEHLKSAADHEHSASPSPIEESDSGLQTQHPVGADEGQPIARAVEPEHVEYAFDDEHSTNLSPFEHFENALLAERAENAVKGEQIASSVETEHHGSAAQEDLLTIEKLERLLTGIYAVRADRRA